MARPIKEGMDYFPHDTDAANDEKIEILRSLHGNDGYVFYFILLERIYRMANFELIVSDAETLQILARKVAVTPQKLSDMIQTAVKYHIFDPEKYQKEGVLTSNGIKRRSQMVVEKREDMRKKYHQEVSGVVSDAEMGVESTQSKVKKSKVKKSKEKKRKIVKPKKIVEVFEPFNGLIEIEKWLNDKQRHIQIVGLWGILEKPSLENKDQFKNFTDRNIRTARALIGYSNERIKKTRQMLKDKGLSYTLETIAKHIDSTKEPKKEVNYQLIDGVMHPIYGK